MYAGNYESLLKQVKEDKSKRKDNLCLWIGRLNIVDMLRILLPKVIYRFNIIPMKIPMIHFAKAEKPILKFTWNFKGC